MVFDNILQLQRQLTDKYVVVDESRPELKRFGGQTGQVKTVNFSGRALVQFDAYNNIGWYDIDPKFLKVIDAPLPKPEAKESKADRKAAPAKSEKPAAAKPAAEAKPAAKPAAAAKPGGGASVADILAAARGGAKTAPTSTEPAGGAPAAKPKSTAEILAAARTKPAEAPVAAEPPGAAAAAKVDPKKLSVADMLAMARGQKPAEASATTPAPPTAKAASAPAPEPAAVEPDVAPPPAEEAPVAAGSPAKVDRTTMDVAAMLAYCRKVDGK